ncbi:hypothetical protein [Parabacteroides sp. Marseille-P3160]|uniref:hypothetical protein n=1 Tax=Parabacteroides sp. Marseille-P3160 TaxID=1917887 RepID=UPI0009BA17FB|nr:hypothetical protein [Parabacteroides sp. Marseille-P3160]
MKRVILFPILFSVYLLLSFLTGCEGLDENYSTDPNDRLTFSADTLTFDTVFTTIGSATKKIMVYNRNNEALKIESVLLANAGKSYRINVDGRKGDSFHDITIWPKDSLYVFVEVTIDPNQKNQPLLVEDSVIFSTNGIRQSVLLQAYGQDAEIYRGGKFITKDTAFTAERPYLIYDSLFISEGAVLTIEPGASLYMHDKAKIIVKGGLLAKGTLEKPITFRGDRMDILLDENDVVLPYDRTPGQWDGIFFLQNSFGNEFDYVTVRNVTSGLVFEESTPEQPKIKIGNSQVTNADGPILSAINCRLEAFNSEFSNAKDGLVTLIGGHYAFTHCTFANYMSLKRRSTNTPSLTMANSATIDNVKKDLPLLQASFDNCIIDGSYAASGIGDTLLHGELMLSEAKGILFNYRFNHCLIKTKGNENTYFVSVLFGKSPTYVATGISSNYIYDYRLANESLGIGKADPTIAANYPADRYGIPRTANAPDIGAYVYVPQEEEKK